MSGRERSEKQWRRLAVLWRESGQSLAAFAKEHECNYHSLRYWIKKDRAMPEAATRAPAFLKVAFPEKVIPVRADRETQTQAAPQIQNRTRVPVRKGLALDIDETFERPLLLAAMLFVAGLAR
jgi:hypothetical protein